MRTGGSKHQHRTLQFTSVLLDDHTRVFLCLKVLPFSIISRISSLLPAFLHHFPHFSVTSRSSPFFPAFLRYFPHFSDISAFLHYFPHFSIISRLSPLLPAFLYYFPHFSVTTRLCPPRIFRLFDPTLWKWARPSECERC